MNLKKAFLKLEERFPSHIKIFRVYKDDFTEIQINELPEIGFIITDDSRRVDENTLFFSTYYSKKFLNDAISKKPVGLFLSKKEFQDVLHQPYEGYYIVGKKKPDFYLGYLSSIYYDDPSKNMYIVAITGTNGKTTTSFMIYHLWKKKQIPCAVIGTLGVYYWNGSEENHLETGFTTPRSYELHKILSLLNEKNIRHIAIEASSEALALRRLEGLNIQKAIFTTFGRDHLDFHQTLNAYFFAKLHLFFLTLRTTEQKIPFIVVYDKNTYYHFYKFIRKTRSKILILLETHLNYPYVKNQPTPLIFNQFNALCALYGASENELPLFDLNETPLEDFKGVPGRVDRIKLSDNIDVIIDYAHTPDALENLLKELKKEYANLILVFGCGGNRDREKRPIMGEIASNYSDLIVLTDDNPRNEDPKLIREEIKKGIPANKKNLIKEIGDRREAIKFSIEYCLSHNINQKTYLVIAGKGHENYQIIQNKKIPFSDKEVVLEFLHEKTTR